MRFEAAGNLVPRLLKKTNNEEAESTVDLALIRAAQKGDRRAFDNLAAKYYNRIRNFVVSRVGNITDAEDYTQDIFTKVFRKIGTFREESSFESWLFSVTRNYCKDVFKKEGRKRNNTGGNLLEFNNEFGGYDIYQSLSLVEPKKNTSNLELMKVFHSLMDDKLSDKEAEMFTLRVLEGRPVSEIMEMLDCSESTVGYRLRNAKKKLRIGMERYLAGKNIDSYKYKE